MMQTMTLDEAQKHLPDLLNAAAGEEVYIRKDEKMVVQLVLRTSEPTPTTEKKHPLRRFGSAAGQIRMSDEFDKTPNDFAEYS